MKSKTYICVECRKKYTLDIQWMIDQVEIDKNRKICLKCQNEMCNEAVYGTRHSGCLNCGRITAKTEKSSGVKHGKN